MLNVKVKTAIIYNTFRVWTQMIVNIDHKTFIFLLLILEQLSRENKELKREIDEARKKTHQVAWENDTLKRNVDYGKRMYDGLQALMTLRTRVGLEIEHAGPQVDVVGLDGEEQHA